MDHHIRPFVDPRRQPEPRASRLCRVTKILTCGCMIATAILFPLAYSYTGGLWFGAVTLAIFILTALIFHSLHIEPFIRFGPYTAPVALLLLLLAVLPAGPSRKDLIPWLPLFIVSCSLVTVAVDKASKHLPFRRGSEPTADEFSGVSIDRWSEDSSYRTVSYWSGRRPPSRSNRPHSIYFARHGPSSQYSYQGRSESDITLGGVAGQFRSTWDAQTQGYFENEVIESTLHPTGQVQTGITRDMEPEDDLASETQSNESDHPLLGPQ